MPDWGTTTARVLCRLRIVTLAARKKATEQQIAAINRVWEFVEVEINEYNKDMSGQWRSVNGKDRREGVRQRLHDGFTDEAFLPDGHAARKRFMRADLLKWGDRLLAEEAAKAAADAALYSFRVPFNSDAAAEAAAAILPPEVPRAADNSDTTMTSAPEEASLLVAGLERLSTRSRSDRCDRSASEFRWADHDSDVSFWSGSSALPQIGEVPDALYDAATGQAPINFTSSRNVSENLSWESPIRHSGGGGGG